MTVRQRFSLFSLFTSLVLSSGLSAPVQADDIDEIQRRDLALIQTQIEQIKVVVDRIDARQQNADPETTRVYFDIPRLRDDLQSISSGIDSYLAPDRLLPRQPQALDGDYLEDRGQ
ncbi:RAQPRD family integrative conjugative element protein [Salinicola sp. JS01]|uniref:integrative conjugative element protein, RAQPRD family n=1 Tax=Salinicola sp. JS01 TaxID=3050071 RepID=UPI00255B990B|nr:RAQPRD family integrative conjugative element protein [Salinicola sp. JS01]WIX33242.1 RAQPRD family integrative conjugative element protein [Salinicola sp. JS01]